MTQDCYCDTSSLAASGPHKLIASALRVEKEERATEVDHESTWHSLSPPVLGGESMQTLALILYLPGEDIGKEHKK